MALIEKEKTADATWSVRATIAADAFNAKLDEVFNEQLPKMTLQGFRKGKAPRAMVEKRYGAQVFFQETADALLPDAVREALKEAELEPIYRPNDLDVTELSREKGVEFSFRVVTAPVVQLQSYKGIEAEVPAVQVTDAQVEARIEDLRRRNARETEVTGRLAQTGDIAVIDFEGMLDGVPFAGGKGENHRLHLGAHQFIPGFEEQVEGHMPGDHFNVHVTFPQDYHAEDLKGKAVVFHVALHELKQEELPELDDDFAAEVGEDYNTVADLRAGIAKELEASAAKAADDAFERGVQEALAAKLEGEIAEDMFEHRLARNVELFEQRMQFTLQRYLELVGETEEGFRQNMRAQSVTQVKLELALEAIAEQEELTVSEEEIETEYQTIADEYKVELARAKLGVPQEEVIKGLKRQKALELVKTHAVRKVADPSQEPCDCGHDHEHHEGCGCGQHHGGEEEDAEESPME